MGSISILTTVYMEAIKNCFIKYDFLTDISNDELDDESINVNDLSSEGKTYQLFSIFVHFDNDLEESGRILKNKLKLSSFISDNFLNIYSV